MKRLLAESLIFSDLGEFDLDTLVCRFFANGECNDGDICMLPHVRGPTKDPDNVCRFYLHGHCNYGKRCWYDHVTFEDRGGRKVIKLLREQIEDRLSDVMKNLDEGVCGFNDADDNNQGLAFNVITRELYPPMLPDEEMMRKVPKYDKDLSQKECELFTNYTEEFPSLSEATKYEQSPKKSRCLRKVRTEKLQIENSEILGKNLLENGNASIALPFHSSSVNKNGNEEGNFNKHLNAGKYTFGFENSIYHSEIPPRIHQTAFEQQASGTENHIADFNTGTDRKTDNSITINYKVSLQKLPVKDEQKAVQEQLSLKHLSKSTTAETEKFKFLYSSAIRNYPVELNLATYGKSCGSVFCNSACSYAPSKERERLQTERSATSQNRQMFENVSCLAAEENSRNLYSDLFKKNYERRTSEDHNFLLNKKINNQMLRQTSSPSMYAGKIFLQFPLNLDYSERPLTGLVAPQKKNQSQTSNSTKRSTTGDIFILSTEIGVTENGQKIRNIEHVTNPAKCDKTLKKVWNNSPLKKENGRYYCINIANEYQKLYLKSDNTYSEIFRPNLCTGGTGVRSLLEQPLDLGWFSPSLEPLPSLYNKVGERQTDFPEHSADGSMIDVIYTVRHRASPPEEIWSNVHALPKKLIFRSVKPHLPVP